MGARGEWKLNVKGAPPITVSWYRDGKKLKSSRTLKPGFVRGVAKLMIHEAIEEENGEYRVEAVNNYGEASLTAVLTVVGKCYNVLMLT